MQPCYRNAIERKRFEVCGESLAPLTLAHVRAIDLTCEGLEVSSWGSVALACFFCAQPRLDLAGISDCFITDVLSVWIADKIRSGYEIEKESEKLEQYLAYYTAKPARYDSPREVMRAPWWGMLKSFLCDKCGYTNEDAWHCVVCEAFSEVAYHNARMGDESLIAEQSLKHAEMLKQNILSQDDMARMMKGG